MPQNNLQITSPAFGEGEPLPVKYTCDGEDINPALEIDAVPPQAKSLALIVDDPDATGGVVWDHWLVFNIPPDIATIEEGEEPPGVSGKNSWGRTGYGGPCPGSGNHRYFFKLYALDTALDLPAGSGKETLERVMAGHILQQTSLMGRYERGRTK